MDDVQKTIAGGQRRSTACSFRKQPMQRAKSNQILPVELVFDFRVEPSSDSSQFKGTIDSASTHVDIDVDIDVAIDIDVDVDVAIDIDVDVDVDIVVDMMSTWTSASTSTSTSTTST